MGPFFWCRLLQKPGTPPTSYGRYAYTNLGKESAEYPPDVCAIVSQYGDRTFAELNAKARCLVRLFAEYGIRDGDSVAGVTQIKPEIIEVLCATARSGIRTRPVNFRLKGEEIGYILNQLLKPLHTHPYPPQWGDSPSAFTPGVDRELLPGLA